MIAFALAAALTSCSQEAEPASAPQLSPELTAIRAACAKLAESPNYTFQHLSLDEGGGGFGRGGRGGEGGPPAEGQAAAPPPAPVPVEFLAHVQNDQPVHFKQGEMEAWRQEGVLVWRNGTGAWERMDMQSMRGGGRGGAPSGGGTDASEEDMRNMRARMGLFSAQAAHELVQGFESKIAMVVKTDEGGKSVYVGSLTPEGAASMSGSSRFARGGRGGGQGGGGDAPTFQNSGSFKIIVDAKGRMESFTLDTLMSGTIQERAIERKRHVEYRFSAVGETKLEVPAEVTTKFTEKPAADGLEF